MIPKIIHLIWFGDISKCPSDINRWSKQFPDYVVHLWTDKDLDTISDPIIDKVRLARDYAAKSDIFRIYLLKTYGGFYFDCDMEIVGDLNEVQNKNSFLMYENEFYRPMLILNGAMGFEPDSELINRCYDILLSYNDDKLKHLGDWDIWKVTGPGLVTYVWQHYMIRDLNIYPSWYIRISHTDPYLVGVPGYLIKEAHNVKEYKEVPNGDKCITIAEPFQAIYNISDNISRMMK